MYYIVENMVVLYTYILYDSKGIRTQSHLFRKRTLNHSKTHSDHLNEHSVGHLEKYIFIKENNNNNNNN